MKGLTWEGICAEYAHVARSHDELPEHAKRCSHPLEPGTRIPDYATCLREGWRWMFESWRRWQPTAYAALESVNPSLLYAEHFRPDRLDARRQRWSCNGFVQAGDRYFAFHPYFNERRVEQVREEHQVWERFASLPEPVAEAYYSRIEGLAFTDTLPLNSLDCRVLPVRITTWLPLSASLEPDRTREVTNALRRLAAGRSERWRKKSNLSIVLDTRPPGGADGDLLFVDELSDSRNLFYMRNLDASTLAVLADPAAALDNYIAHMIAGPETRFDFRPYLASGLFLH